MRIPPSSSVTCASSHTCGPCEMIHVGRPKCRCTSAANSSPSASALVNTTGARTVCPPAARVRSRSTSTPVYSVCPSASRSRACSCADRSTNGMSPDMSASMRTELEKSPTRASTSSWRGSRSNAGRLSRNRSVALQWATTSANAVASTAADVNPLLRASSARCSFCSDGSQRCRRVTVGPVPSRSSRTMGSVGAPGRLSSLACHHAAARARADSRAESRSARYLR